MMLMLAATAMPASAEHWTTVPSKLRDATAPLPVAVHLVQDKLLIGPDPGAGMTPNNYGLIGALLIGALEDGQSKRGRAEVLPLLQALGDFDGAKPLMAGVSSGLAEQPWIQLVSQSSLRDGSIAAKDALLETVDTNYLIDIDCRYNVGESFQAIFGICSVRVADKRTVGNQPGDRWKDGKLAFSKSAEVEVALDTSVFTVPLPHCYGQLRRSTCRAKWMDNSAALMRQELTVALNRLGRLAVRALSLSAAEADIKEKLKTKGVMLSMPYHSGALLDGGENIIDVGRRSDFMKGAKQAVLKTDSDGASIIEVSGSLYDRRVIAAP
ncbi:hypothetical protein [Novosphingobium indicum]|nr:hypothetical protein [Novosphingobium indicum]